MTAENAIVSSEIRRDASMVGRIKLAVLAMHPVQYHTPLYKRIFQSRALDAKVLYLDTVGLEGGYDKEFQTRVKWDIPLLDGHEYEFLRNVAPNKRGGFFSRINLGIPAALKRGRFDAILIQGYSLASCWIALFAARWWGIKVIWRGEVVLKESDESVTLRCRLRRAVIGAFLRRCDALMYTCDGNKAFLRHYVPHAKKLHPFICAVDNEYFRNEHRKHSSHAERKRSELGIPGGNLVVLFCGRFTSWKRPLDVLLAVKQAGNSAVSVVFVGNGPLRAELVGFAHRNGIHAIHVGFVNQSEISCYYSIADVLCLPSARDNSPKALNEAMNFGLVPIVTGAVGTCDDLIIDGVTGFKCAVGDTQAMAACIVRLSDDPGLRQRMAVCAREHIAKFSYEANVAGLEAAVREALTFRDHFGNASDVG